MTKTAQHRQSNSGIGRRVASAVLTLVVVLGLGAVSTHSAQAQTNQAQTYKESVLYSFTGGTDGANPETDLQWDTKGNLLGFAPSGGDPSCGTSGIGCGVVFKLSSKHKETVLYTFTGVGTDGAFPAGNPIWDAKGNLYGVTGGGGTSGVGTVYKLNGKGKETTLYSFTGGADGEYPAGQLILDAKGNLYGTTPSGGDPSCKCGTVFKLSKTGVLTVLHTFTKGTDGAWPYAYRGLVFDAKGNLYGTTEGGGSYGAGTVYKVNPKNKRETVLYAFTGGADGGNPYGSLIFDAKGNLYGTTSGGGIAGGGTVFRFSSKGGEQVLYSFTSVPTGYYPVGSLTWGPKGSLYGTTYIGGDPSCNNGYGCGVVFKLSSNGTETVLHTFSGADGVFPAAGLTWDAKGNLYGTTYKGGSADWGVVYKLSGK